VARGVMANTLAAVAVAGLAAAALTNGASRVLAPVAPSVALMLNRGNSDAALVLAQQQLAINPAAAEETVRRTIAGDPYNVAALRTLGVIESSRGRPAEAYRAMRLAGDFSWRDGAAESWLMQYAISHGDLRDAVARADSLLRRAEDPDQSPVIGMLAAAVQLAPPIVEPLAQRLAIMPLWRDRFLVRLGTTPGLEAGARALLRRLRAGPTPPTAPEAAALVYNEVGRHEYAQALSDWRELAPEGRPSGQAAIRDGGFRREPDGSPFMWTLTAGAGADQERTPVRGLGAGAYALNVRYDGYSTPDLASQIIVLPPGTYVLSWRERVDEGDAHTLGWGVTCAVHDILIAQAPPEAGDLQRWRQRRLTFTVPASECDAQRLRLAAVAGDRHTDISVDYTDLAVAPASAARPVS
jgi:hypothetical protein